MADISVAQLDQTISSGPFHAWLGTRITEITDDGEVSLTAQWRPEWGNGSPQGFTHGGIITGLLDLAAECAVIVATGSPQPTLDLSVRFLAATAGVPLQAKGRLRKLGKSVTVADAELFDDAGRLIAVAQGAFASFATHRPAPGTVTEGK